MYTSDLESIAAGALNKSNLSKKQPFKFLMKAIVAGFYIVVATILSNVTAAVLYGTYPQWGRLIGSFLFATAIILIVFFNGELFTGNNMTMAIGVYQKKIKASDMVRVWVYSFVGNFIGCFILGAIFYYSNSCRDILRVYYESCIPGKLSLTPAEFFLKGILCNFMVCLAVLANTKMKTESGKLTVMFMVIMAFVVAGFEHCVANMGTFTIAGFILGGLDVMQVVKSMVFVTLGNAFGGAVLLGGSLKLMAE